MARTKGAVDADYKVKRVGLLEKIKPRLMAGDTRTVSFREMAAIAKVSIPTLRHYFSSRSEVVSAVLEHIGTEGRPYIGLLATASPGALCESLQTVGKIIMAGVRHGQTVNIHALGLNEGMGDATIGPSYLNSILEPTLQALEERLAGHMQRGEMRKCDGRFASLNFVAPLLIALLHQSRLGGSEVRPLSIEKLLEEQISIFMKAYGKNTRSNKQK